MSKIIKRDYCKFVSDNNNSNYHFSNDSSSLSISGANQISSEIVEEALKKAADIMEKADSYSKNVFRDSQDTIEELKEQANKSGFLEGLNQGRKSGEQQGYKEGYSSGYKEGQIQSVEQQKNILDYLLALVTKIDIAKDKITDEYEKDLISLSVLIAESILKDEIKERPEDIQKMAYKVIASYKSQKWIRISVSEKNKKYFDYDGQNILESLKNVSDDIKIISDSELNDFECVVETPSGYVDLGIDTQIKNIQWELEKLTNELDFETGKEDKFLE